MASEIFPFSDPLLQFDDYQVRRFRGGDAESIARHANNYRIWKQLRDWFPHPYTREDAEEFIDQISREYPSHTFAIATESEAIGTIGYHPGSDVHRYSAELGFWLAEPYHGKGIMTEAVRRFSDHLLGGDYFLRLWAGVFSNNPASMRVLEKAGFVLEGVLKASVVKDGELLDQHLYAKMRPGTT
ncbi:GCN5-related N-acetyltransferase [Nitrospina gracilis 3/211]|uniref:GCN5-related N-acetyltransferase n=1 Tax=Nitrospina gracilis (strain 3/211) TaxID=1266370 RepID=M1Z935_NITG3|nr:MULTISPECIES: GNAT family N-acetyltransferase [Nitrospina]MCF8722684.1 RimJ/RimL family protein N-acetyltransferase [Nitrospina sp. Nb-3]CCQ89626.1 GCN5-related N-acetyltransferase [Nitrospina gracilis 3/211]